MMAHYKYVGFEPCSLSKQIVVDLNRDIDNACIPLNCVWKTANINEKIINITLNI
jgi:hypothetical protein